MKSPDFFNIVLCTLLPSVSQLLKELHSLQTQTVRKIEKAINGLAQNPRPIGVKKLKGNNEDLYRIRSGDYLVVYAIEDEIRIVDIRKIGHRKDIYK